MFLCKLDVEIDVRQKLLIRNYAHVSLLWLCMLLPVDFSHAMTLLCACNDSRTISTYTSLCSRPWIRYSIYSLFGLTLIHCKTEFL
jgi:hypothetical protein